MWIHQGMPQVVQGAQGDTQVGMAVSPQGRSLSRAVPPAWGRERKGIKCVLFALPTFFVLPCSFPQSLPPAGWQLMINSWKMLKACQEQDFNAEAAKPAFPPVLTPQLQPREDLQPPSTTLCSPSSPCQAPGAAQAPATQSGQAGREEQRQGEPRMVEELEKGHKSPAGRVCVTRTVSVTSCCTGQGSWRAASDRSRAMCYGALI